MCRSQWIAASYLGLRIALGMLLIATMVFATRFGWFSPRFHLPFALRFWVVLVTAALLTALMATFKRLTAVELAVFLALFYVVGMLLFPGLNGHTGEPDPQYLLW